MSLPLPASPAGHFLTLRPMDSIIWNILVHHSEDEWLDRCRVALPLVSDGEILSIIQRYFCDDVENLIEG